MRKKDNFILIRIIIGMYNGSFDMLDPNHDKYDDNPIHLPILPGMDNLKNTWWFNFISQVVLRVPLFLEEIYTMHDFHEDKKAINDMNTIVKFLCKLHNSSRSIINRKDISQVMNLLKLSYKQQEIEDMTRNVFEKIENIFPLKINRNLIYIDINYTIQYSNCEFKSSNL